MTCENISLDIQKSSSWLLFHHGLYHTYCHHDADGYATRTQVLDGLKIWIFVRPEGYDKFETHRELWEACTDYINDSPDKNGFYGDGHHRFIFYAKPGDIMYVFP